MTPLAHVDLLVGHHTAGRPEATVEELRRYHMDAHGWPDIGYHFVVTPEGKVHQGRSTEFQGAHAYCSDIGRGVNHRSLGLVIVGDYSTQPPPTPALMSALLLVVELRERYGPIPLRPHRQVMAELGCPEHTDCPGKTDWTRWVSIRLPLPGEP